ncbi:MAG: DUF1232 domain-containing protein [Polyangiaceae bacterium]|nr:DUF1232 domain-containing protein [Polyangiaceae bacterium]NUQ73031.1 DUF1232 domain-containing protein [Polyangiaceae bacterium]
MIEPELENRCLDTFPEWLRTLASDASELALVLKGDAPEPARRHVAAGLSYLFKSLDLIPDGIEDLGFLDDAFVLRVCASFALAEWPSGAETAPILGRLAGGTKLIEEVLVGDYRRLVKYARSLDKVTARGRTVEEILADELVRDAFIDEVVSFAASFEAPSFARDGKNIVKLQSFLATKLPA